MAGSRRSTIVTLSLVGVVGAAAIGDELSSREIEMRRNLYADRAACERDYSPTQCEVSATMSYGSSYGYARGWYGPSYAADRGSAAAGDPGPGRVGGLASAVHSAPQRPRRLWRHRPLGAREQLAPMRREIVTARPDWAAKVEALGLDFHTSNGEPYWWEAACYAFSAAEIDAIEAATETLHALCLEAVDRLVTAGDLARLDIPERYWPWIAESWRRRDPDVYGRFDLSYDGVSPPKLLEYNADTPTALLEAAVVQWYWLEEVRPGRDQFNSIHEKLIDRWRDLRRLVPPAAPLHLSGVFGELEDRRTVEYMQDVANQAGWPTRLVDISEIGWNGSVFTDLSETPIRFLFKLYPWEWMLRESFGEHLPADRTGIVEPPWKMVLSNKAILAVLWEMFPGHPNLLPAARAREAIAGACVEKPIYGREGRDVRLLNANETASGRRGRVYQAAAPLPVFAGWHALIGSWVVGGKPAGMGMREDRAPVTRNTSRFVPHYFT